VAKWWLRAGVVAVLVINLVMLFFLAGQNDASSRRTSSADGSAGLAASDDSASSSPFNGPSSTPSSSAHAIKLAKSVYQGQPFKAVKITGTWEKGARPEPGTPLRVELRRGDAWSPFPLPAVTGPSGEFTAYVELGAAGRYRLRVVAPTRKAVSDTFTVMIQ
jgi:hypothetical protein